MASGKTAVGRRLARRLGWDFIDTDELIESRKGCSISEIFARDGEDGFRRVESETVCALRPERPTVISTGGGTYMDEESRKALHRLGIVVHLVVSMPTVMKRVCRGKRRPLATGPDAERRLSGLLESRTPTYRLADVLVETDGLTIDQAVSRVMGMIEPRLRAGHGSHGGHGDHAGHGDDATQTGQVLGSGAEPLPQGSCGEKVEKG